jgi:hypothetical protein
MFQGDHAPSFFRVKICHNPEDHDLNHLSIDFIYSVMTCLSLFLSLKCSCRYTLADDILYSIYFMRVLRLLWW